MAKDMGFREEEGEREWEKSAQDGGGMGVRLEENEIL